ncbi:delta-60 repeat domain-containing protein [Erythrobacter aureus]|uniref:delta-60 repeat domain-containing protein n=1 Tax=Erythrobacter aureus TaxID=2182384 RepID=UPI001F26FC1E|nr:delta-60 repeat domain-containing protein [Erythrobacter aureus]
MTRLREVRERMSNFSSSVVGLSILSGTNGFASFGMGSFNFETRAVREAKAAFLTPETIPPWKQSQQNTSLSARVSEIRALPSIIDTNVGDGQTLTADVAATFTTYKALDRLRVLAEAAVAGPTTSVRETLQGVFSEGLTDLQAFLGGAAGDSLSVSFDQPSSNAKSVPISTEGAFGETLGAGVAEARDAPLPDLTGTEQFEVTIKGLTSSDVIAVDLTGGPQPPTLDSVSAAINAAIASVPKLNADGTVQVDGNGDPVPKWGVEFNPDKSTGSWGFKILNPGLEEVSIDQVGADDALMIATGMTGLENPSSAQVMRIVDPAGASTRETLANISGLDRLETERAELNTKDYSNIEGVEAPPTDRFATTSARAMVTAADGSSYIVGTTAGDLASNRIAGSEDLFLTKVDSEGNVLWQRELGAAGSAEGAAVSIGQNGEVVVAGTVTGMFDGDNADGDMLVARFDAKGEELSSTLVRALGSDTATAVTVGNDGSIYVGGRTSSGSGDAFVARLDADGSLRERRRIDSGGSDTLNALAIGQGGEVLALTREGTATKVRSLDAASLATDLGEYSLGQADARALAVADDGTIAVGGATRDVLNGGQVNTISGGRDGFVARVSSDLEWREHFVCRDWS